MISGWRYLRVPRIANSQRKTATTITIHPAFDKSALVVKLCQPVPINMNMKPKNNISAKNSLGLLKLRLNLFVISSHARSDMCEL